MKRTMVLSGLMAVSVTGCRQLDSLVYQPPTTPAAWCSMRPCVDLGGLVLSEPLGTFLVYLLAVMALWAGWHCIKVADGHKSRQWWGAALILGGVAAALAGTSYQAFSYELKCAGREFCVWTSLFEVAYQTVQNASAECMAIGVAYSCTSGQLRRWVIAYAWCNAAIHLLVTIYGALTASQFLISFELLLLFSMPVLLGGLIWNGVRYIRYRTAADGALLGAWVGLFAVNAIYYTYLLAGYTQALWKNGQGFYFSENDVLHVGMIIWMVYFARVVAKRIADLPDSKGT